MYKFTTSITMYNIFGVILYCKISPNGAKDLMYIIPGVEQIALTLGYRRSG